MHIHGYLGIYSLLLHDYNNFVYTEVNREKYEKIERQYLTKMNPRLGNTQA